MHFLLPRSIRSCFGTCQYHYSPLMFEREHTIDTATHCFYKPTHQHRCLFTALLYLSEMDDFVHGPDSDDPTQAFRYRNAPNALEYTMIHLTGDFPLIDYTLWGRIVCFLIVFAAVGVTSVPQGLIANGFTETLEETRSKTRRRKVIASITIQRMLRRFVQRRTCF